MSVKTKSKAAKPIHSQIEAVIAKAAGELYKQHSGEIDECLKESEDKKLKVTFGVEIDCSESESMVTVGIRFSTSVTDKRVSRLDDPNQITLFNTREEAEPKKEDQEELAEGAKEETKED